MALIQLPSMDDAVAALIVSTHAFVGKAWWNVYHTHMHTHRISRYKPLCVSGPRAIGSCWELNLKWIVKGIICGIMGLYVTLCRDVTCLESPDTAAWFKQEIGLILTIKHYLASFTDTQRMTQHWQSIGHALIGQVGGGGYMDIQNITIVLYVWCSTSVKDFF